MKHKLFSIMVIATVALAWACEADEEFFENDPIVKFVFINQDSLLAIETDTMITLTDSLAVLNDQITSLTADASDTLEIIEILQDQIDDVVDETEKEALEAQKDENQLALETLQEIIAEVEDVRSEVNVAVSFWNSVIRDINSGLILIEQIENQANDQIISFVGTDSLEVWNIPLSMNSNSSSLLLTLGGEEYELNLTYELRTLVNERDNVLREAFNVEAQIDSKFTDIEKRCQTSECIGSETVFTLYF